MWSDASWHHLTVGLDVLALRVAALQAELRKAGREGITPEEVLQRLYAPEGSVHDALEAVHGPVSWDLAA